MVILQKMAAKNVENKTEGLNHVLTLITQLSQSYKEFEEKPSFETTISDSWLNTIQPEFLHGNPSAPLNCEEYYSLKFSPEYIRHYILNKALFYHQDVINKHVSTMIMYGLEYGDDLDAIECLKTIKPAYLPYFRNLMKEYHLETKACQSRTAITLTRVCLSYPDHTCLFLHENKINNPNHAVFLKLMESISKNYPREMMTFAFAFLIPNRTNMFCLLLRKAHMLYQFIYFIKVINPHIEQIINRIISHVIKYCQAVINRSHLDYDFQIMNLKRLDLLTVNAENITVTEKVVKAAKVWDELIKNASNLRNLLSIEIVKNVQII